MNPVSSRDRAQRLSVFLIEDSADDAFFFERVLKKSRIECDYRHLWDGQALVDLLKMTEASAAMPDLIFLDLKMPRLSGFEVLTWLRETTFAEKSNVVVLSGSDDRADRARAKDLGAAEYLVKPIRSETLQKVFGEVIGAASAGLAEKQQRI